MEKKTSPAVLLPVTPVNVVPIKMLLVKLQAMRRPEQKVATRSPLVPDASMSLIRRSLISE